MIVRTIQERVVAAARQYPVVTITGPRQSGKTTLCQMAFPDKAYVSLEDPDTRELALSDPRRFLGMYPDGAILDEIQRAPDIPSYLLGIVDERKENGLYILTGSQHLGLISTVSQSLAGRTAIIRLLPLGLDELRRIGAFRGDLFETLWAGAYPAIHDRDLPPVEWLSDFVTIYVEREVRQVLNVGDLLSFQTFLGLAAGRSAQLINLSSLGADCGISYNTARAWISVLEATFIAYRLSPFRRNIRKRLVKAPKLLFFDTGLLCFLLGIRSPDQLANHPLRGAIFETWVLSEINKARAHRGLLRDMHFYRDRRGLEIDAVLEAGGKLIAVEAKSGQTVASDFFAALERFEKVIGPVSGHLDLEKILVYGGGDRKHRRQGATVLPWHRIVAYDWAPDRFKGRGTEP